MTSAVSVRRSNPLMRSAGPGATSPGQPLWDSTWQIPCDYGAFLQREPALPREIAPQVSDLAAVVELVKQHNAQIVPHGSGVTGRGGELALQVGWREGFQDSQRFLPHRRGIALQGRHGGLQRHHLLESMASPRVLRIGRHTKLL